MKRKVVIITDCTDVAYLEIRGAIYSNAVSEDFEIEPVVRVDNFNIVNVSFLVRLIADIYPDGTLINVVVHPSKFRGERIAGITEKKRIIFEGTNTGAFGWLIKDFGCMEVYELYDPGFVPFGGKYIHAPTVGHILSGRPIKELGTLFPTDRIRDVPFIDIEMTDNMIVLEFFRTSNDYKRYPFTLIYDDKSVYYESYKSYLDWEKGKAQHIKRDDLTVDFILELGKKAGIEVTEEILRDCCNQEIFKEAENYI